MNPLVLNAQLAECGLILDDSAIKWRGTFRDTGLQTREEFELTRRIVVELGGRGSGLLLVVPKGYVPDGYSMPGRILQAFQPRHARWLLPSILHDWLYDVGSIPRSVCDAILFDVMKELGVPHWQCLAVYLAVRAGGWGGFNKPLPINLAIVREARMKSLSPDITKYLKETYDV